MTADLTDPQRAAPPARSPLAVWAVPRVFGYRMPPVPDLHRGLPSPYLTLVFSLSGPLPIEFPEGDGGRRGEYGVPVGGLHTRPVLMPTRVGPGGAPDGKQCGIQLAVNPLASRALFGMPAGELGGQVLELDAVIGRAAGPIRDRLGGALPSVDAALPVVTAWIEDRLGTAPPDHLAPELGRAWRLIVGSGGRIRIADAARDVGWSRRHLTSRLRTETGLGAKDLARVTRFQRGRSMLVTSRPALAEVAASCGYTDQSHLTAEWREFAGCTPGHWIAAELPSLARLTPAEPDPILPRPGQANEAILGP